MLVDCSTKRVFASDRDKLFGPARERSWPSIPPPEKMFAWTQMCDIRCVKVVIVGQDPYPRPGQANGVLLLNSILTKQERSNPKIDQRWEMFTDAVIARNKSRHILGCNHLVLQARHPAADFRSTEMNNTFWGYRHFSKCNRHPVKGDKEPINWADL
ncbi:hypothetical protein ScPMuIL_005685 [Solemya velum]